MEEADKIMRAALKAAINVLGERPYVGGLDFDDEDTNKNEPKATERALSGRLGIWLARTALCRKYERKAVVVDLEYDQMGRGQRKLVGKRFRRIDLLVHKRAAKSHNFLVCEVKAADEAPSHVDQTDLEKLTLMTASSGKFGYKRGLWIAFPRSPRGSLHYAVFINGRRIFSTWTGE